MSEERVYRMRDLERISGVPRSTIHYYVREGLLPQPRKRGKTVADYGAEHIQTLQLIRRLQEEARLSLDEIRTMVDEGRPKIDPNQLEQSLDLLMHYAMTHAQPQKKMEEDVERTLEAAAAQIAKLAGGDEHESVQRDVTELLLQWQERERVFVEEANKRELDLVFRVVFKTGRLDLLRPVLRQVVRLAMAGSRSLSVTVRDRAVVDFISQLRDLLVDGALGPHALDDGQKSALGVDRMIHARELKLRKDPSNTSEALMVARLLAWHGEHKRLLRHVSQGRVSPDADGFSPEDRAELAVLLGWSGSVCDLSRSFDTFSPQATDSTDLIEALARVNLARHQIVVATHALKTSQSTPEHFQMWITGMELLEALPELAMDANPWPSLFVEVNAAGLLGMLPPPLAFTDRAKELNARIRARLDTVDADHDIRLFAVDRVIARNL